MPGIENLCAPMCLRSSYVLRKRFPNTEEEKLCAILTVTPGVMKTPPQTPYIQQEHRDILEKRKPVRTNDLLYFGKIYYLPRPIF